MFGGDWPSPRIFLADDHPLITDAFKGLFTALSPAADVVGFTDVSALIAALDDGAKPDLVLIDYDMPGLASLDAVGHFLARYPDRKVAVISGHVSSSLVTELIRLGCVGFVPKRMRANAIYHAIQMMVCGGRFIPAAVIEPVSGTVGGSEMESFDIPSAAGQKFGLTPRELQVLASLVKGHTNKHIARELNIADATVRLHLRHAYVKLKVENRIGAVRALLGDFGVGSGDGANGRSAS